MKEQLTARQQQVLNYIKRNLRILPPTLETLGELSGITKQSVFEVVLALKKKGFLDTKTGLPKSVSSDFVIQNGQGETIFDSTRCKIDYYDKTIYHNNLYL